MRNTLCALAVVVVAVFFLAARAELAGIEPVGKLSVEGGAEKEEGSGASGRVTLAAMGVMPVVGDFGLQARAHYVGGFGSRFGLSAGPLFSWESGKAGLFVAYEHRTFNSNNFVYIRPSVAFYLPQANINLFYSQPVSNPQRDGFVFVNRRIEYGTNHLVGTFNYFPDLNLGSFIKKDNLELMLGVQVNSFGGAGTHDLQSGVGPVFGIALMPIQGWELNVVKGTVDNRGRYRVLSGVAFYFDKLNASLKALRRRYLEPNLFDAGSGGSVNGTHPLLYRGPR